MGMAGEKGLFVKPKDEREKQAEMICEYLDKFDENSRPYFILFCLSELLNLLACAGVLAYYFLLLKVDTNNMQAMLSNWLLPTVNDGPRYLNNDYLLQLFPRDIACVYQLNGPSGTVELHSSRCKVTNQDSIEMFHIISFFVSAIVFTLYIANIFYLMLNFLGFATLASSSEQKAYDKVSYRKKLVLLLLNQNIDSLTHNLIMEKIANTKPKISKNKNDGNIMTNILVD